MCFVFRIKPRPGNTTINQHNSTFSEFSHALTITASASTTAPT